MISLTGDGRGQQATFCKRERIVTCNITFRRTRNTYATQNGRPGTGGWDKGALTAANWRRQVLERLESLLAGS
jgi:hypothetical protein